MHDTARQNGLAHRNVYCTMFALVTEAYWARLRPEDIYPSLDVVFEAFGLRRLMFGSD